MINPAFVVEQFMCHFLSQWHHGLQPTLNMDTKTDGSIAVSFNVTVPVATPRINDDNYEEMRRSRSGRGSRLRRRKQRSSNVQKEHNSNLNDLVVSFNGETDTDISAPCSLSSQPEAICLDMNNTNEDISCFLEAADSSEIEWT